MFIILLPWLVFGGSALGMAFDEGLIKDKWTEPIIYVIGGPIAWVYMMIKTNYL